MTYVQQIKQADRWPGSKQDALEQITDWQRRARQKCREGLTYKEAAEAAVAQPKTRQAIMHLYAEHVAQIDQLIAECVATRPDVRQADLQTEGYVIFRYVLVHYQPAESMLSTYVHSAVKNRLRNAIRDRGAETEMPTAEDGEQLSSQLKARKSQVLDIDRIAGAATRGDRDLKAAWRRLSRCV